MKLAKDCLNIQEIRDCIDEMDYQIMSSFGKRMEYVKEIVKFKADRDGIVAYGRQLELLQKRRDWAAEFGLNPELFEEIYKMLINSNVEKELELFSDRKNTTI